MIIILPFLLGSIGSTGCSLSQSGLNGIPQMRRSCTAQELAWTIAATVQLCFASLGSLGKSRELDPVPSYSQIWYTSGLPTRGIDIISFLHPRLRFPPVMLRKNISQLL